jgi:hypothetical protein
MAKNLERQPLLQAPPPPPPLFALYYSLPCSQNNARWLTTSTTTATEPPLRTILDKTSNRDNVDSLQSTIHGDEEVAVPHGDTNDVLRSFWNAALQRALYLLPKEPLPNSWKVRVDASAAEATTSTASDTSKGSSSSSNSFVPPNGDENMDTEDLYSDSPANSRAESSTCRLEPLPESPHYDAEQQWKLDTTIRLLLNNSSNEGTLRSGGGGEGWSMEDWFVVEDLLVHYWSRLDTIQAVLVQFALLEQCLLERNRLSRPLQPSSDATRAPPLYPMTTTTTAIPTDDTVVDNDQTYDSLESLRKQIDRWLHLHLLNDMVESWRLVYTVHADTFAACHLTPTDLLHRVVHVLYHELGLSLDAKTFYYIAEAEMCRPSRHSSPEFVQAVLMQTIDLYRSHPETLASCFPKVPLWNFALTAWVKADRGADTQTAVTQLLQLMDEYNVPRSKRTYLTALQACVQQKSVNGAMQAEQLLQRMYQEYLHSDNGHGGPSPKLQPDVYAFTAVVDAWAKSRSPQAGPRAEQIYQQMLALRHKNHLFGYRKADTTLINCALMCYANPKPTPESVAQAEAFWRQSLVPPDVITYATLIQLYASTENIAAAERLWNELWDTAVDISGHPLVVTEVSLFATMLAMYAKSKLPNRIELATAVLQRMKESKHVQPNTMVYNGTFCVSSTIGSSRTNAHIVPLRS